MRIDQNRAVEIASDLVTRKGIRTLGLISARRVECELRGRYLAGLPADFWLITLRRSGEIIEGTAELSPEDLEIMEAVAMQNDTITVAVEMDGTAQVV